MNKNLTNDQIKAVVQEAYNVVKSDTGGKNADYIPYLANVSSSLFGISVCLPDGEVIEVGDTGYVFGIESVSKVPTAILVMKQYGADVILQKIGADATGLPFNSIMAILLENDHPSSPLVNAGAISACSMVKPVGDSAGKWKAITDFLGQLCGSPLVLIDELYKSESDTNFNNRSIAWLLKNYNRIYDDPDMSLDIYTRQCSLGITPKQLSICGGTIANRGVNPVTKTQVFDKALAPKIYGRFLPAYRRLDVHLGRAGQNRCRRRCARGRSRRDGHSGLLPPARRCGKFGQSTKGHFVYRE